MNVLNFPKGQCPKATDVSPWYGVYASLIFLLPESLVKKQGRRQSPLSFHPSVASCLMTIACFLSIV
jgi:hypothetical protein